MKPGFKLTASLKLHISEWSFTVCFQFMIKFILFANFKNANKMSVFLCDVSEAQLKWKPVVQLLIRRTAGKLFNLYDTSLCEVVTSGGWGVYMFHLEKHCCNHLKLPHLYVSVHTLLTPSNWNREIYAHILSRIKINVNEFWQTHSI